MTVVPQSCPPPESGLTGHHWAPLHTQSCPFMPIHAHISAPLRAWARLKTETLTPREEPHQP